MHQFAARTHPGHKRKNNEDCFAADPELGLWLVADGVGGHASGEVASAIVASTLRAQVAAGKNLAEAISLCHLAVLEEIHRRNIVNNMGSTVVALTLRQNKYNLAWVGDSRAYLWDGNLRQLSRDHNPVSELLARGAITTEEAAIHPDRHILTQSLGVSANMQLQPGSRSGTLAPQQQILLCSDGLNDELSVAAISRIMASSHDPQAQVDALLAAALAAGGRDNITVIIVDGDAAAKASGNAAPIDSETEQRANQAKGRDEPAPAGRHKAWLLASGLALAVLLLLLLLPRL